MPETGFVETEALLAIIRDEDEEAEKLLQEMFPGELLRLIDQATRLAQLAFGVYAEKEKHGYLR